jgi:hypothetical protein
VGKRGVETAMMIQGLAYRKTMKRPRSIPWLSSKENEESTDQAMAINAARSLQWHGFLIKPHLAE